MASSLSASSLSTDTVSSGISIEFVSIGARTLNFSNKNQTVDNFDIKWPRNNELLTMHPLNWGFFFDVEKLDDNATLKIGIFVPEDNRVCPVVWNHEIYPNKLKGTIWYWNLTDIRKRAICMTSSPTTLRSNYGNRSEVQMGSSIGAFKDYDGSIHFVVNDEDQGVAVAKIPRNFFYGWVRLGCDGNVKITHRMDLSLEYYSRRVLSRGIPKLTESKEKSKRDNQKKVTAATKNENEKKKGREMGKEKEKKKEKESNKEKEEEKVQATEKHDQQNASSNTNSDFRAGRHGLTFTAYRMTQKPRGHCLIISNSKFHDKTRNREGASVDERAMKELFEEQLHYIVTIRRNLTAREMEDELYAYARKDHKNFDAFVCVIMTHGADNNVLFGIDERRTKLEDLMSEVKPTNCSSLRGKPKFFIVQACRGETREDVASSYCPSSLGSVNSTYYRDRAMFDVDGLSNLSTDSTLPRSICPIEGDFLLACATTPGYVALRDRYEGSIFMQVLVDVFRKYHNDYHAVELLTEVNRQVAEKVEEISDGTYWQMPAPSFTLRALFYM